MVHRCFHGLPLDHPITVQFSRSIIWPPDPMQALRVIEAEGGKPAPGEWQAFLNHTCFIFWPNLPLQPRTRYRIGVGKETKDTEGRGLSTEVTRKFQTAVQSSVSRHTHPLHQPRQAMAGYIPGSTGNAHRGPD